MIFDQMFRKAGYYTVIPFGYETIIPELIQYTNQSDRKELIDNIRSAPDFALVSHDPKQVLLVEVKYRSRIDIEEIRKTAQLICERWKLVWLFVASPDGFYFNSCNELGEKSELTPLSDKMISRNVQDEFLALIKDFISG